METKEFKIQVPNGFEIDRENSTFECIKFKPKKCTSYKDVCESLFKDSTIYFINNRGAIEEQVFKEMIDSARCDLNNCASRKQAEKLLAINQLMNIAKYLNKDWEPNWKIIEPKYYLNLKEDNIGIDCDYWITSKPVYFKTIEFAEKAIKILGEDTIKLALSADW